MRLALYPFWLLPLPVLATLVIVMYRRKQHLSYPIFWGYSCFQCAALAIEFICKFVSYKVYFYVYWIGSSVTALLIVLLLRRVFVHFLQSYPSLDSVRRYGFEFAVSIIWFTALALNLGFMSAQAWPQRVARAGLIVSFTEVGVFVFVLITTSVLGIRWKSAYCGIAAGLGLLGIADLLMFIGLPWIAASVQPSVLAGWIQTLAYDAAVAIFALYFLPAPVAERTDADLRPELLEWAQSLKGAVRK